MQFSILHDEYYFVTNILHLLKFFKKLIILSLNLIQYTSNKQKNSKCVVYTYTKKTKCNNVIFMITIFGGVMCFYWKVQFLMVPFPPCGLPCLGCLLACLDFGPSFLFLFLSLSLGAVFLLSLARFHQLIS
jgi:hypothetical protein